MSLLKLTMRLHRRVVLFEPNADGTGQQVGFVKQQGVVFGGVFCQDVELGGGVNGVVGPFPANFLSAVLADLTAGDLQGVGGSHRERCFWSVRVGAFALSAPVLADDPQGGSESTQVEVDGLEVGLAQVVPDVVPHSWAMSSSTSCHGLGNGFSSRGRQTSRMVVRAAALPLM